MSLISCDNLSLGYDGKEILHGLSFMVDQGEYLCIVGENGSGKSTLMQTILGLQSPVSGAVHTGDGLRPNEIGYLPQQTVVQKDFPASVWEIVLSGCQSKCGLRPFYRKEDKVMAQKMLEKLGLTALKKRCYRELSGGQQQRVLLARALCATRDIAAAIKYASHILHIGPTIYYGTKEDYVNSPLGQRFLEESGVTE